MKEILRKVFNIKDYRINDEETDLSPLEKKELTTDVLLTDENVYIDIFEDGFYEKVEEEIEMPSASLGVFYSEEKIKINISSVASYDPSIQVTIDKNGEINIEDFRRF